MDPLNNRIKTLMDFAKMDAAQFSEKINVQRSSISHILSGRNKPSLDFLVKVRNAFPDLSWDWLILGSGEMLMKMPPETPVSTGVLPSTLFDLIHKDDNTASGEVKNKQEFTASEFLVADPIVAKNPTADSQSIKNSTISASESTVAASKKVPVQIIWFYEDGTFDAFMPKKNASDY